MKLEIKALSPITHGGFTEGLDMGNLMQFRRMPVICDGVPRSVPVISGNAVRGRVRRALAYELFDRLNLRQAMADEKPGVYDKLFTLLATGGTLGKDLDKAVDPEHIRQIRACLPMFSLLGGAAYKYILSGMVNFGFAVLRCAETGGELPAMEYIAEIGQVKHVDGTLENKELTENKPMPYTVEAVVQGAVFDAWIDTQPQITPLEKACLAHGLKAVKTVGGKAASGYGRVEIVCDEPLDDGAYVEWLGSCGESYVKWMWDFAKEL